MIRDQIIAMAREAGIPDDNIPGLAWGRLETGMQLLERFAALIAAAERERCAQVADAWDHDKRIAAAIRALGDKDG